MEFTLEKVKDLFNTGQFSGICKAAGSDHISLKLLPPDARVLIAHAHVYAGRSQVASALAQSLIQGKNSPAVTAHALIVSGLANKRDGHIDTRCELRSERELLGRHQYCHNHGRRELHHYGNPSR